jgi:hypothetical protein
MTTTESVLPLPNTCKKPDGKKTPVGLSLSMSMNGGGEPDFPEARALQYSPERW